MATFETQVEALTGISIDGSSSPTQTELSVFLQDGVKDVIHRMIEVKPGEQISLQRHFHRSEHWVVTHGEATIEKGENTMTLTRGDYIFVEKKEIHRIKNESDEELRIVEVQIGDLISEEDIERLEDIYARD